MEEKNKTETEFIKLALEGVKDNDFDKEDALKLLNELKIGDIKWKSN